MTGKKEIALIERVYRNAGFAVTRFKDSDHHRKIELHSWNNPDGTIRWLWPAGSEDANCLRFYNIGSARAKLFAKFFTKIFSLKLEKRLSRNTVVFYANEMVSDAIEYLWGNNYAIFTGTVGPNRKAVIWHRTSAKNSFVKVALSETSAAIIRREKEVLWSLQCYRFKTLRVPELMSFDEKNISVTDVSLPEDVRAAVILPLHGRALLELYDKTCGSGSFTELSDWFPTIQKLKDLSRPHNTKIPVGLVRKLTVLLNTISEEQRVQFAMAHGDFTPWNMFISGDRLSIYDLELAIYKAPIMWDVFHFIFQAGILMHRQSASEILTIIKSLENIDWYRDAQAKFGFDPRLHLKIYLVFNCTYYLHLYSLQPDWHVQVNWLIDTWTEAVSLVIAAENPLNHRQLLTIDLFDQLERKPYATLKWIADRPEQLPLISDIDICIEKSSLPSIHKFLLSHSLVAKLQWSDKSFMRTYSITTANGMFLSVDLIWQFKRKQLEMLSAATLLHETRLTEFGVRMPSVEMDFLYTWLFYILNGTSMPKRYSDYFLGGTELNRRRLNSYFLKNFGATQLSHFSFALENNPVIMKTITRQVQHAKANTGISGINNRFNYMLDSVRGLFTGHGMIITFSGVDGAGKSTIIENTKTLIEKSLRRKVVVIRHRPSLLPILSAYKHGKAEAEKKAASTLPRLGSNKSTVSSFLRFFYYFMDYFFGQFYVKLKYVMRGYVVLYDRYYFDFINDSRRSNIQLPRKFTAWFYKFLLKPDLNFFLYAQPEEILKRKQELDAPTIRRLTDQYLDLFDNLSKRYSGSKYIPIHNQELNITLDTIFDHVKKRAS